MRNPTAAISVLIIVFGMNFFGVRLHPQEHSTDTVHSPDNFAGCYQVAGLSRGLIVEDIGLFPTRFELLNVPRAPGTTYFNIRSLDTKGKSDPSEASWTWSAEGKDKLEINWGTGFGGFRGTLKKSGSGELVGKLREYCDSRCGYKRRNGSIHLRKISCGVD